MDKATLDTNYLRHLRPHFLNLFETKINPTFVIDVFHKYNLNVLTEKDKSLIRAETNNKGPIAGSVLLFERLVLYDGWYSCLLNVLRDREVKLAYVAEEMEELKKLLDEHIFENEMDDVDQILLTKCRMKLENEKDKNEQLENIVREKECALQQCQLEKAELEEKLKTFNHVNADLKNKLHAFLQENAELKNKLHAFYQENAELKNKLHAFYQEVYTHKAMATDLRRMLESEEAKNKQMLLQNQTLENSVKEIILEKSNLEEKLKGTDQARCATEKIVSDLNNELATVDITYGKKRQLEGILDPNQHYPKPLLFVLIGSFVARDLMELLFRDVRVQEVEVSDIVWNIIRKI